MRRSIVMLGAMAVLLSGETLAADPDLPYETVMLVIAKTDLEDIPPRDRVAHVSIETRFNTQLLGRERIHRTVSRLAFSPEARLVQCDEQWGAEDRALPDRTTRYEFSRDPWRCKVTPFIPRLMTPGLEQRSYTFHPVTRMIEERIEYQDGPWRKVVVGDANMQNSRSVREPLPVRVIYGLTTNGLLRTVVRYGPDGRAIASCLYERDAKGRVFRIQERVSPATTMVTQYVYDDQGRIARRVDAAMHQPGRYTDRVLSMYAYGETDARGNWLERTRIRRAVDGTAPASAGPETHVIRRTFAYYATEPSNPVRPDR